ncbi:VOC family protein [Amycolatopsis sp. K13G38]|uniref:VOC family protein n=1 Tax=Amycolatopsis acididurans TaxID=2724524 RepID=A0ABX1JGM1_9PSEU|nr:VOC family protein [Amycolatopsis acididurans]NKQ57397.1 VOC family protein [Amycolatopsis acididurans]
MTATLSSIVIDCADPAGLAAFYAQVTGWDVASSDEDSAAVGTLGFQRIANYPRPGWPDDAKHFHLDFAVGDLDVEVKRLLDLGAAKPEFQPGGSEWVVLTDPEGHPFCLVPEN